MLMIMMMITVILHETLKPLNLHNVYIILMQKAMPYSQNVCGRTVNKKAWSLRLVLL